MKGSAFGVLVAMLLAGSSAMAHHSYGGYATDQKVSIEGRIENVLFANPHVILQVRTNDNLMYDIEWSAMSNLRRQGIQNSTLLVGDNIVVTGSPKKDPKEHRISLLTEVRRPKDGWEWSQKR